eukprot:TRINITY_DN581_c0_g1_i1.p1 TRINITY_DN581_c0_g1~~TRINITY_DN581_c0_g1_i1.p1  ORF type:complete len:579 (+),score=60.08 TRINITY_DN581_c0_g1_i1:319-2055(+)
MPFYPPSWVPNLPYSPPDSISIDQFLLHDQYRACSIAHSRPAFTCGVSGRSYTTAQVKQNVEHLASGLAGELGWRPNTGKELHKVVAVFAVNTIDTLTLVWATHRLGGVLSPANAAYSAGELAHQLSDCGAKVLFTCRSLLPSALVAADKVGIAASRIYILPSPLDQQHLSQSASEFRTIGDLIYQGQKAPSLERLLLRGGEGARRVALLCYSSGTSGLPKGVMISHRNVIANVMQLHVFKPQTATENVLALVPFSHIYGLIIVAHLAMYRGDCSIVLPKFEFKAYLDAIQRFKINDLCIVPPVIILMTKSKDILDKYNLSSVCTITTGAAPLRESTAAELKRLFPACKILQGYGMTETSPGVCNTAVHDELPGSSGSLLPGTSMRLVTIEGNEIEGHDQPGEIWVKGPNVTLGYLNNANATRETMVDDGWLRTGDEGLVRKHPTSGHEHVFIVDRLKELIKVNGLQVAPAELEAHLLTHPAVLDCVVIGVPAEREGEVPKAFIVKSPRVSLEESDSMLRRDIGRHVQRHMARHKWLKGGVEFIDAVPKSPSGKILRRVIREQERTRAEADRSHKAKL